jgi:hypothetical protein
MRITGTMIPDSRASIGSMSVTRAITPGSGATMDPIGDTAAMIPDTIRPVRAIGVAGITAITPNSDRR